MLWQAFDPVVLRRVSWLHLGQRLDSVHMFFAKDTYVQITIADQQSRTLIRYYPARQRIEHGKHRLMHCGDRNNAFCEAGARDGTAITTSYAFRAASGSRALAAAASAVPLPAAVPASAWAFWTRGGRRS